jgi:hypothetical protein
MASPGPLAAACPEDLDPQAHLRAVTPAMDRRNGRIFCASHALNFPNYLVAISPAAAGTRNLALLTLVSCASSVAPVLYGGLTQLFGFRAAFALGAVLAASSLWLVTKLPGGKR